VRKVYMATILTAVLIIGGICTSCSGPIIGTTEWYIQKAYRLNTEGNHDDAIIVCSKAIELTPGSAEAYCNRAWAYREIGEYDLSIADCTRALELDPGLANAYYNRALTYKMKGRTTDAIADLEMVLTITTDPQITEMARQQIEELSK